MRKLIVQQWVTVDNIAAEEDGGLSSRACPWTGTQQGPLLDLPATGRRVEVDEMIMFRVVGGLIVEAWEVWDEATMRRQLTNANRAASRTSSEAELARVRRSLGAIQRQTQSS